MSPAPPPPPPPPPPHSCSTHCHCPLPQLSPSCVPQGWLQASDDVALGKEGACILVTMLLVRPTVILAVTDTLPAPCAIAESSSYFWACAGAQVAGAAGLAAGPLESPQTPGWPYQQYWNGTHTHSMPGSESEPSCQLTCGTPAA